MPGLPDRIKTPLESLIETATTEPELPLVIENADTLHTYADIFQRIQHLGSYLIRENLQIIGIHTKLEILHIVGSYSAFYAGIPFVFLNPDWPPEIMQAICGRLGIQFILFNKHEIQPFAPDICRLDYRTLAEQPIDLVERRPFPEIATYYHTSGSTGAPKSIICPASSILEPSLAVIKKYYHGAHNRIYSLINSVTFLMAYHQLFQVAHDKGSYVYEDGDGCFQIIPATPSMMKAYIERKKTVNPNVQQILLGGEPVTADDLRLVRRHFPNATLVACYGSTEANYASMRDVIPPEEPIPGDVTYTPNIDGVEFQLLDEDLTPVKRIPGNKGYVALQSPYSCAGYVGITDNQTFSPSGQGGSRVILSDMGEYAERGRLRVLGRQSRTVKINGVFIDLNALEEQITAQYREMTACKCVKSRQDLLFVFYSSPVDLSGQVPRQLRDVTLNRVIRLDQFPLGYSGKISLAQLQGLADSYNLTADYGPIKNNPLLYDLSRDIGALLDNPELVGFDFNLTECGLNSLMAMRISILLKDKYRIIINPAELITLNLSIGDLGDWNTREAESVSLKDHYQLPMLARSFLGIIAYKKYPAMLVNLLLDTSHYSITSLHTLNFDGTVIERERLRRALDKLLTLHSVLKTRIRYEGLPTLARKSPLASLDGNYSIIEFAPDEDEDHIAARMRRELRREQHMIIVGLKPRSAELHIAMNHIIFDIETIRLYEDTLTRLYLEQPDTNQTCQPIDHAVLDRYEEMYCRGEHYRAELKYKVDCEQRWNIAPVSYRDHKLVIRVPPAYRSNKQYLALGMLLREVHCQNADRVNQSGIGFVMTNLFRSRTHSGCGLFNTYQTVDLQPESSPDQIVEAFKDMPRFKLSEDDYYDSLIDGIHVQFRTNVSAYTFEKTKQNHLQALYITLDEAAPDGDMLIMTVNASERVRLNISTIVRATQCALAENGCETVYLTNR